MTADAERSHSGRGMTWPETVGLLVGAAYTVVGVAGLLITGFEDFFGHSGDSLLGFMINPFHNLVHVVQGLTGLVLARTLAGARIYGWLLAVVGGTSFVYGLVATGRAWDFLGYNWPDNFLHLATALIGAVLVAGPASPAVRRHS